MRARQNPILALLALGSVETAEQQRTCWRQALTALGEGGINQAAVAAGAEEDEE